MDNYKYPSYKADFDKVNGVYDAALNKDINALKASYDQTVAEVEASKAKIPQTYQTAANQSAANYQREKAAFDEAAAANGINTGAGSQVKLSMLNNQQTAQTGINTQRANAATDAENQILKLKQEFQSAIAQANANNEYERSAALLKEYQNEAQSAVSTAQNQINLDRSQTLERAETLARFGDFSGYEALGYTPDQTAQMQNAWIAANFSLAKKMGLVSGGGYGWNGAVATTPASGGVDNEYLNKVYRANASTGRGEIGDIIANIDADAADGNVSAATAAAAKAMLNQSGMRY